MAYSDPGTVTGGLTPARATWANTVRGDLVDHEARILVLEAGLRIATVTLNNAQIKALPSGDVEVLPAPASGKRHVLVLSDWRLDSLAGAYTNIDPDAWAALSFNLGTSPAVYDDVSDYLANDSSVSPAIAYLSTLFGAARVGHTQLGPMRQPDSNWFGLAVVIGDDCRDLPLLLHLDNNGAGNFTGGNVANTMTITTAYYEVTG
jgi:hypothetical protein